MSPIKHWCHRKASIQSTFIQSKPQGIKVIKHSLKGAAFYTKAWQASMLREHLQAKIMGYAI
ncbi:hypothetical protein CXF89_02010 [Pseudoalteromonas sp. MelDa3]|nr:hypothetical protein CXF89_02010 [Pseudoalteromonas sp. MelDa3]